MPGRRRELGEFAIDRPHLNGGRAPAPKRFRTRVPVN